MPSHRVKRHKHIWRRPFRPTLCADFVCLCGRTKWPTPLTSGYRSGSTQTFYEKGGQKKTVRYS